MIELASTKSTFDVEVVVVVGVKRIVRVEAFGDSHARIVAKDQVSKENEPQVWQAMDGTDVTIDPGQWVDIRTGMCPTKVES